MSETEEYMARPNRCRRICKKPFYDCFIPYGFKNNEEIFLSVDEYEVIRLIDYEKNTHEQCSRQMDIARTTVTEIYERARFKIADSIINGKKLVITGGNYRFCDGNSEYCREKKCRKDVVNNMRIAVTYENGQIFQHFGHTENFKVYDVTDGKITSFQIISTMGQGHGALAEFLSSNNIDALICGGIGGGAKTALADAGIQLYAGVSGNADDAVNSLIAGTLQHNPDVQCNHHKHGENHKCGEHGCH